MEPLAGSPVRRVVVHVDMDEFFVQVHRRVLQPAALDGVAKVAIQQHDDVICVSHAARLAGARKHMQPADLRSRHPDVRIVQVYQHKEKVSYRPYQRASFQIFTGIREWLAQQAGGRTFVVEKASIDEMYVDVTDLVRPPADPANAVANATAIAAADVACAGDAAESSSWDDDAGGSGLSGSSPPPSPWRSAERSPTARTAMASPPARWLSSPAAVAATERLCARLQDFVFSRLGYHCSVGAARNRLLAKWAAALAKPQRVAVALSPAAERGLLHATHVTKLRNWVTLRKRLCGDRRNGVGGGGGSGASESGGRDAVCIGDACLTAATASTATVADLQRVPLHQLTALLGERDGRALFRQCRGDDPRPPQLREKPPPAQVTAVMSLAVDPQRRVPVFDNGAATGASAAAAAATTVGTGGPRTGGAARGGVGVEGGSGGGLASSRARRILRVMAEDLCETLREPEHATGGRAPRRLSVKYTLCEVAPAASVAAARGNGGGSGGGGGERTAHKHCTFPPEQPRRKSTRGASRGGGRCHRGGGGGSGGGEGARSNGCGGSGGGRGSRGSGDDDQGGGRGGGGGDDNDRVEEDADDGDDDDDDPRAVEVARLAWDIVRCEAARLQCELFKRGGGGSGTVAAGGLGGGGLDPGPGPERQRQRQHLQQQQPCRLVLCFGRLTLAATHFTAPAAASVPTRDDMARLFSGGGASGGAPAQARPGPSGAAASTDGAGARTTTSGGGGGGGGSGSDAGAGSGSGGGRGEPRAGQRPSPREVLDLSKPSPPASSRTRPAVAAGKSTGGVPGPEFVIIDDDGKDEDDDGDNDVDDDAGLGGGSGYHDGNDPRRGHNLRHQWQGDGVAVGDREDGEDGEEQLESGEPGFAAASLLGEWTPAAVFSDPRMADAAYIRQFLR